MSVPVGSDASPHARSEATVRCGVASVRSVLLVSICSAIRARCHARSADGGMGWQSYRLDNFSLLRRLRADGVGRGTAARPLWCRTRHTLCHRVRWNGLRGLRARQRDRWHVWFRVTGRRRCLFVRRRILRRRALPACAHVRNVYGIDAVCWNARRRCRLQASPDGDRSRQIVWGKLARRVACLCGHRLRVGRRDMDRHAAREG